MDKSLTPLCHALKKILKQLKAGQHPLALNLVTGKIGQGKSSLLRQSNLEHVSLEHSTEIGLYYNENGVFIELGESWLNQSNHLLQYTLKRFNQCHRQVKISGIILCVDINDLFISNPDTFIEQCRSHALLLERFGSSLNQRMDVAIFLTKLDTLAGFCDFFQHEHTNDIKRPLGFSPNEMNATQFDKFIDTLGQQVIHKIHPARSSIKRTHIREFPLQIATLRPAIQRLIKTIPSHQFHIQAIYFTSALQSGISLDRINKKIQHEYALSVQDAFPQSMNYRAYFIEGAMNAFQQHTKCPISDVSRTQKMLIQVLSTAALIGVIGLSYHHFTTTQLLDQVSKELLAYETLTGKSSQTAEALYHLTKASASIERIRPNKILQPTLSSLKKELQSNAQQHLSTNFLPQQYALIEHILINPHESHFERYQALKIYLMLGDMSHCSKSEILAWFNRYWAQHPKDSSQQNMVLLRKALDNMHEPMPINQQLVVDVRNYLNALPANYLYYSLAKSLFPTRAEPIKIQGFMPASPTLPIYFTKNGFEANLKNIPHFAEQLRQDNWILARQDLHDLTDILRQAYCYDYVTWWKNFIKKTTLQHAYGYHGASQLAQTIHNAQSIDHMIHFIQEHTSPNLDSNARLFNQAIASQFTEISLMSDTASKDLNITIHDLDKFLTTLAMVHDGGKTAFNLTKSRFNDEKHPNPMNELLMHAKQLPNPIATWAKQLADESWNNLFKDARTFINEQWKKTVYQAYLSGISQRFPFSTSEEQEISMVDFNHFFSHHGILNQFTNEYIMPFLDTSEPLWQLKESYGYVLPISQDTITALIRANVITNMFFPEKSDTSEITFSLQKLSLDPIVSQLSLMIGKDQLIDTQDTNSFKHFHWPKANVTLSLNAINGKHYELKEHGDWALFKLLQKVNIMVDEQDSANLQILFDINSNTGRYLLRTENKINPFIPGILNGFVLNDVVV